MKNKLSRRKFLADNAKAAGILALSPLAADLLSEEDAGRIKTFGIQLYTVRDLLEKKGSDTKEILKQLGSFGYKQIESYERAPGIFWGLSNIEFKKTLDDLGMEIISSHCDVEKNLEKKADEAAAIGMKYLLSSSLGRRKTSDDYKKLAEQFNHWGEICRKAGLKFGYHGEEEDYRDLEGQSPIEILIWNSDPAMVDFEIDIWWVNVAGQDAQELLKNHRGRFNLCHIKDHVKDPSKKDSCDLGAGSIDIPSILKTASKNGMKYYFVEQEQYPVSPMKSSELDAGYMKRLRF